MRHVIVVVTACLTFLTVAVCVFRDVSFSTTLFRAGVVAAISLLVGFVVVSTWVSFSLVGTRKQSSPEGIGRAHEAAEKRVSS
jgi:hypothetical protein